MSFPWWTLYFGSKVKILLRMNYAGATGGIFASQSPPPLIGLLAAEKGVATFCIAVLFTGMLENIY
jgi:hypothetical protein